jgi:hypothetical protein
VIVGDRPIELLAPASRISSILQPVGLEKRGGENAQPDQTLLDRSRGRPVRNPPSTKMQSPVT